MPNGKITRAVFTLCIALFAALPSCTSSKGDVNYALLWMLANRGKFYCGTAVDPDYFDESDYTEALTGYFNALVAENQMKWEIIQPAEGTFDYTEADEIVDFARARGMAVRGHTILWHVQLPAWVEAKSYAELEAVLESHINAVMGRYRGKIYAWDVVNEVMMNADLGFRNVTKGPASSDYSIWAQNETDDALIKKAFEFAHAADPSAKLFLNDNNGYGAGGLAVFNQQQADLLYNRVKAWKESGVPIHGVGFQLHLAEDDPPDFAMIENDIARYVAQGLEVHFTEIDIRINEDGGVTAGELQHQAEMYEALMDLARDYSKVTSFFVWGVTDKYTWIDSFFPGYGSPLLLDDSYNPKPAYEAIRNQMP